MEHRRLGRSGVKVSVLSFGSWVSFDDQLDDDGALACMQAAWDAGVTFFDNAEAYAGGESERIMGRCFERLGWDRRTYTVSTKLYWGLVDGPNSRFTLNRKYLLDAMDRSLERFGLDFVDLLYCHRSDPETPMEEVVWTMSDIVASGRATYWGTSEWSAAEIREAWDIADRHHLRKPVVEQPQYNLLCRRQVEVARQVALAVRDPLCRRPDGQPVAVPPGDADTRLELSVVDVLRGEGVLQHHIRRCEPRVEVATLVDLGLAHAAAARR